MPRMHKAAVSYSPKRVEGDTNGGGATGSAEIAIPYRPYEMDIASPELLADVQRAKIYAASGYFGVRTAEEAYAKIMVARGLGVDEVLAMTHLHAVNGRLAPDAHLMTALIRKQGRYDYKIETATNTEASVVFACGDRILGRSVFTWQDAIQAGLHQKDNWKKYPRNMLLARALSNGARWYCPDAVLGIPYFPEELGSDGIVEEVIE